jgi:LysM repeat protein
MKAKLLIGSIILGLCAFLSTPAQAADTTAESVGILEEKVNRLSAQMEDLQFRQKKLEDDLAKVKEDLRDASSGANSDTIKAMQDRIAAIDAAREKDKKAMIDEVARLLAAGNSGKPIAKTAGAGEYVVQKGDTLSSIAKANGCTVAELRKANNLAGSAINVGQKLTIPQK